MQRIAQHQVLVAGDSFSQCRDHVLDFFAHTNLVRYDEIRVLERQCRWGPDEDFAILLEEAEQENKARIANLVRELQQTGAIAIDDLINLEHGYPSKVLHVLCHFLDGFVGIDTWFYNLIDDSHRLPTATRQAIEKQPERYRLIHIDCYSATPEEAALLKRKPPHG